MTVWISVYAVGCPPAVPCCRFLAVDRGALRYPTFCITRDRAVFSSRHCLVDYEESLQLAAQVDQALEVRKEGGGVQACLLLGV